ncbi:hypothetical protein JTB14_028994 [Gonioctena quinquepunctata]|nr:hypothetical protein JTB14_028994 [Gonioctena quinquepunctata]
MNINRGSNPRTMVNATWFMTDINIHKELMEIPTANEYKLLPIVEKSYKCIFYGYHIDNTEDFWSTHHLQ